jgi:hypothetical protein
MKCVDYLSLPYLSKLIICVEFCVSVSHNGPYAIILKYPDYFILLLTLECFKMTV